MPGGEIRSGCFWWQLPQSVSSAGEQVAFGPELVKMTHARLRFSPKRVPHLFHVASILGGKRQVALRSLQGGGMHGKGVDWGRLGDAGVGPHHREILSFGPFWSKAE